MLNPENSTLLAAQTSTIHSVTYHFTVEHLELVTETFLGFGDERKTGCLD